MLIGILIFAALVIGIWSSYRLFMRGDTPKDRVARFLPADFKPDMFHQKGDTYVGFERSSNRLVVIDWPHGATLSPQDVHALDPESETMLGLTHYWLVVEAGREGASKRYRIWFQFRRAPRDAWLARLAELRKGRVPVAPDTRPTEVPAARAQAASATKRVAPDDIRQQRAVS